MLHLKTEAEKLRDGAYFVKRGIVNWPVFFGSDGSRDQGIAVMMDEGGLFEDPSQANTVSSLITLEMFAKTNTEVNQGLDDALLDCLIEDGKFLVQSVITKNSGKTNQIAYRVERSSARFTELHDLDRGVQGIIINFRVNY
jgi:hypothetical protein